MRQRRYAVAIGKIDVGTRSNQSLHDFVMGRSVVRMVAIASHVILLSVQQFALEDANVALVELKASFDERRNVIGKPHFTAVMRSHCRASRAGQGTSFYSPRQASEHQPS